MNLVFSKQEDQFDFCLVSLWNQPVAINPLYHFTRTAIGKITSPIINKKLSEINPVIGVSDDEKSILRYQIKYPCAPALLALAAGLEDKYNVCVISLDVEREQIAAEDWLEIVTKRIASKTRYGVLISFVSTEITQLMLFTHLLSQMNRDIKIIVGGVHATYNDNELLKNQHIDYVVRNEGEETIVELCDAIVAGNNVDSIRGITFRNRETIRRNPDRPFVDMENLPIPAYHLVKGFIDKIVITTMFSRGCPYACDYCAEAAFWTSHVRYKNVKRFVDELEMLCNVYNQHFIHIADSTFGVNRVKLIELCDELEKRSIKAFFSINIRPNVFQYMGEELVRRLRKLNFVEMYMGVESADGDVIKALNRKPGGDLYQTLRKLKEIGIPFVKLYLMIGSPMDNRKSFEKTLGVVEDLLEQELIFYATCKYFVPSIGTPMYLKAKGDFYVAQNSVRMDRYNSPPLFVPHETIAEEMDLYLQLLQVVQYRHYLNKCEPHMRELLKTEWENFVDKHYLRGLYF